MIKVSRIWLVVACIFIGYSGGIITGVVVDVDTVFNTTVEKIKQKKSPGGSIVIDVDTDIEPAPTRKEIRKAKREQKKNEREGREK